jgi:undecaprenyl-diphosphatase
MNFFDALILGLIEGLTEYLPVSSTGHLILASHALGIPETEFLKSFEIAIQLGAILAVVALNFRVLLSGVETWKRILAAFLPTAVLGLVFYKVVKSYLLGSEDIILAALFMGGIFLILFELFHREQADAHEEIASLPLKKAFAIGLTVRAYFFLPLLGFTRPGFTQNFSWKGSDEDGKIEPIGDFINQFHKYARA